MPESIVFKCSLDPGIYVTTVILCMWGEGHDVKG